MEFPQERTVDSRPDFHFLMGTHDTTFTCSIKRAPHSAILDDKLLIPFGRV